MQTGLDLSFGDGDYSFRLPWAGCAEIERKSGAPIMEVYARIMDVRASSADVIEVIRQGLLGGKGGTVDGAAVQNTPHAVNALIDRYVSGPDARPFLESWQIAQAVLNAFMVGYEPAQKKSADPMTAESPVQTE